MGNLITLLKRMYRKLFGGYSLSSLLSKEIEEKWRILDVGCGRFSSLQNLKKDCYKVGLDIYPPYIEKSKSLLVHDRYVVGDARNLPFESDFFDCVVATEVIEHLTKRDGLKMIKEMERVAKKKILMTTPNGFLPTYAGSDDNPEETHLCGYTVAELKKLGFKVYGYHGLKALWKVDSGQAIIRFKPRKVFARLTDVTELFVYHHPSLAFQFFLVKDIGK